MSPKNFRRHLNSHLLTKDKTPSRLHAMAAEDASMEGGESKWIEHEFKYLIRDPDWVSSVAETFPGNEIEQYYVSLDDRLDNEWRVRRFCRSAGDDCTLTFKGAAFEDGSKRTEIEMFIGRAEFDKLAKEAGGRGVTKKRHVLYKKGGYELIMDCYKDGTVVMELEMHVHVSASVGITAFKDVLSDKLHLLMPSHIYDITDEPSFKNKRIAVEGMPDIKVEDLWRELV